VILKEDNNDSEESQKINSNNRFISLWIDGYDDVFSDFDLRPFSSRNISDDFLNEVKKGSHESDFHITELRLLLPEKNRDSETENIIAKLLHSFFTMNEHYFIKKKGAEMKKSFLFIFIGSIMLVSASLVSFNRLENILTHILLVIFEPAGWFLVWTGMEKIIYISPKEKPELDFFSKISKSKIVFLNT
jgi:hypothetical protein